MHQVPRSRRSSNPGFGRLLATGGLGLAALVTLGLGIYAWNAPEQGEEESTRGSSPSAPAPGSVSSWADPTDLADQGPATDGTTVVDRVGTEGGATGPVRADLVAPAEDLTDIDRPVSYADAEARFSAGDYAGAARYFAAYVEEHPDHVWSQYMLGLSRLRDGRAEDAEVAFLAVLDRDGDHEKALVNLARARLERGRAHDALVPIERALEVAPESNDVRRVHGRVLAALGRRDEAEATYRTAIALDDQDSWSMNNLGLLAIEREAFTEAIPPLARAAEIDSTVAVFWNNLGIALERVGDFEGAISAYEAALVADLTFERATVNLGRAVALRPSQSREPIDLAEVAGRFAAEFARADFGGPAGSEVGTDRGANLGSAAERSVDAALVAAPLVGATEVGVSVVEAGASAGSEFE